MSREKKDPFDRHLEEEEAFYSQLRGESRQERKRAKAKDRSKYKKTDREKREAVIPDANLEQGLVLSIHSQGMRVQWHDKEVFCYLRGGLKQEKDLAKNIVAVGDRIRFRMTEEGEGLVMHVEPRSSLLCRTETLDHRRQHILAANVDQVLITVSVVDPVLRPNLIDRYLIAAKKGNLHPVILINKVDLLQNEEVSPIAREVESEMFAECLHAYSEAKVPILGVSALDENSLETLREWMQDKISVFSGPSGTGKTSLINVMTGRELRVGATVKKTKKGAHTTTLAQLLSLPFGGWCVDTPGIKSFGVWDLDPMEVRNYFTEIGEVGKRCRFPDCSHLVEEGCAVQEAVENGTLSELRFSSYQALMQDLETKHRRR